MKPYWALLTLVLAIGLFGMACVGPTQTAESPLRTGANTSTITNASRFNWTEAYQVNGGNYSGFSTATIRDEQATRDFTYQEVENVSDGRYDIQFSGKYNGIPTCTTDSSIMGGGPDCVDIYRTDRHRVNISFLGSGWIITQMTSPVSALAGSNGSVNGGTIRLAKEAEYHIVSVSERKQIGSGALRVRFDYVSVRAPNVHPAVFSILDLNGTILAEVNVTPGETYTYANSATGQSIKIHVYQTAPGVTLGSYWTEMAIFSDEITLSNGQSLDLSAYGYGWANVSLVWKNRDAGTGNSTRPDSLSEIVLYKNG